MLIETKCEESIEPLHCLTVGEECGIHVEQMNHTRKYFYDYRIGNIFLLSYILVEQPDFLQKLDIKGLSQISIAVGKQT